MADYFTLTEFRTLPDMSDAATYTDAKVESAAAYFTEIVEREVRAAMIPRTFTETFDGEGRLTLVLSQPHIRSLTSVTVDGASVDTALLNITPGGAVRYLDGGSTWSQAGLANVVVTYVAGKYETCPGDVKDAVMWATRDRLLNQSKNAGTIDTRKTSLQSEFGTTTYVLPGEKRPTGYPDLDAVIASRSRAKRPMLA